MKESTIKTIAQKLREHFIQGRIVAAPSSFKIKALELLRKHKLTTLSPDTVQFHDAVGKESSLAHLIIKGSEPNKELNIVAKFSGSFITAINVKLVLNY